jgi:PAS domain S-box-containing protein
VELSRSAEVIAAGNFDQRIRVETNDEIEDLAGQFNTMAGRLKESQDRLRQWNEALQAEVQRRTAELHEAEREKREKEEQLASILRNSVDAIIGLNAHGEILSWNRGAEMMFGYGAPEVIARPVDLLVPEALRAAQEPERLQAILAQTGFIRGYETTRLARDGRAVPVDLTCSIARDTQGEIIGLSLILRDITRRRELEEEQRRLREQLSQADSLASLGEIASAVVHEVANPLAAIKTVAQAAEEEGEPGSLHREYMGRIVEEVDRLNNFLQTFRGFAHPFRGRDGACDVRRVFGDVWCLMHPELVRHGIQVVERYPDPPPILRVAPQQMRQLLLNLLVNAIVAMPNGGQIQVEAEAEGTFRFADTGVGIPAENLGKVFDPFFTTKPNGTGLGLAIVHRIVRDSGGSVSVESREGAGTTFTLRFPLVVDAQGS